MNIQTLSTIIRRFNAFLLRVSIFQAVLSHRTGVVAINLATQISTITFSFASIRERFFNANDRTILLWFPWNSPVFAHSAREIALAQRSFYSARLLELTIIFHMSLSAFQIDLLDIDTANVR